MDKEASARPEVQQHQAPAEPTEVHHKGTKGDIRRQIRAFLKQQRAHLPGTRPVQRFVHRHPLHHLQHLPFAQAVQQSMRDHGYKSIFFLKDFRALHAQGRVLESDLITILTGVPDLDLRKVIATLEGKDLCQGDIYLAALLHPIVPIRSIELAWALEEERATERFQADVPDSFRERLLATSDANTEAAAIRELWQASLQVLGIEHQDRHPEEYLDLTPEQAEHLLEQLESEEDDLGRLRMERLVRKTSRHEIEQIFASVGQSRSLSDLIRHLSGRDLLKEVTGLLLPMLSNFLDLGQAAWRNPQQERSFFRYWLNETRHDLGPALGYLPEWPRELQALPQDAMEVLVQELDTLGLKESQWQGYLQRLIQELPGWSAQMAGQGEDDLLDLLAVRLVLERCLANSLCQHLWHTDANFEALRQHFLHESAEFLVRHHLFNKRLPEYLAHQAQVLIQEPEVNTRFWWQLAHRISTWQLSRAADRPQGHSILQDGWRLFRLAQHLGISGKRLRSLDDEGVERIMDCLDRISDPFKVTIWQLAYEFHYRHQLFNGLRQNWGRQQMAASSASRASVQLITSMDNRLEGLRRHLEEIGPDIETFGMAPPQAASQQSAEPMPQRSGWHQWLYQAAHNQPLTALGLATLGVPLAVLDLGLRLTLPGLHQRLTRTKDPRPETQPDRPGSDSQALWLAERFLQDLGLMENFAPLVVILGQTATSQNNSSESAFQGQLFGLGPDNDLAVSLARLYNRPDIRAGLAEIGIEILSDTWFLALTHDSSSQALKWQDIELMPTHCKAAFRQFKRQMTEAQGRHAQEGCRRLPGAPQSLDLGLSIKALRRRSLNFNQSMPEFGHAGVAAAIIGRRHLTRGLFLDRRVCLISYNPELDARGQWLERLLLRSVQPLLDLSMSHFFSRVDDQGWGSGSQSLHGIQGLRAITRDSGDDLATGLSAEMVKRHEPMRLQLVLETDVDTFNNILDRHQSLAQLFDGGWLLCALFESITGSLSVLEPVQPGQTQKERHFRIWAGPFQPLPRGPNSNAWYFGQRGPLAPAMILSRT